MKNKGFTLVEMAVVLIIVSAIVGMFISGFTTFMQHMYSATTHSRQVAVKEALIGYLRDNKRLPCPSVDTVGENAGVEKLAANCSDDTNKPKLIPYKTLGLPKEMATDGWGNYYTYLVSSNTASPDYPRNWSGSAAPGASLGDIAVDGREVVVVLISHGPSGDGAWAESGTQLAVQPSEAESDHAAKVANSTGCPRKDLRRECFSPPKSEVFDDLVYTVSKEDLVAPLYKQAAMLTPAAVVQAGCAEAKAMAEWSVIKSEVASSYDVTPPFSTTQSDPMDNAKTLSCKGPQMVLDKDTPPDSLICAVTSGTNTCRVILADIYGAVTTKGFKP